MRLLATIVYWTGAVLVWSIVALLAFMGISLICYGASKSGFVIFLQGVGLVVAILSGVALFALVAFWADTNRYKRKGPDAPN